MTEQIAEGFGAFDYPEYESLRAILDGACEHYGDHIAYCYKERPRGEDRHKSWHALRKDIFSLATALHAHGAVYQEERLAVIGENSYPWVLAHNAAVLGLGVSIPLDHQLPDKEALRLMQRGKASILAYSASHLSLAERALESCDTIKWVVALGDALIDDPRCLPLAALLKEGKALLDAGDRQMEKQRIAPEQLASICFTSGTTADSKGVMLSHKNIASNAVAGARCILIKPQDRCLSVLPLHHSFENTVGMYSFWVMGLCICINDGLRYIGSNLKTWEIGVMMAVPLLIEKIYEQIWRGIQKKGLTTKVRLALKLSQGLRRFGIDIRKQLFQELREQIGPKFHLSVIGAAPLDPEVARFFDAIGIDCLPGYGLTESAPILSCNRQDQCKPASAGYAIPGVSLRIDPQTQEILAKGPNIMQGYLDDPELTAECIDEEGWLHTGDIGYLEEDGALFITGRMKSMIVLDNGKKAFPEEIERLVNRIDGLVQSMVFQSSNKRGTTIIGAKLQVDPEGPLAPLIEDEAAMKEKLQEALKLVNQEMPSYKAISCFVWSTQPMHMTTTLKIKRAEEKAALMAALEKEGLHLQDKDGARLP